MNNVTTRFLCLQEMRNAEYFATSIRHLPLIEVPQCYEQLCSRRVLTMDWLYGKHITDADENQVQGLVRVGVQCYLSQLLNTGFVHADPHPGNLMCLDGSAKLGIIDFGQVRVFVSSAPRGGLQRRSESSTRTCGADTHS